MRQVFRLLVISAAAFGLAPSALAQIEGVGQVSFPTSASHEAQEPFLRGVAILHSFGWKQAIEQFQTAQELEPDFALAYWGESLCYNHPLISEWDLDSPREVLQKLGATPEERLAKAPTDREKGFVRAVEALFFGEGDAGARRVAYMEEMKQLHAKYPGDHEVAAFYALSLLSAAYSEAMERHRGQVLAGSIAMQLFSENPNHPGAAHYTIHAFDDPVHAPLALPAARKFAEIAASVSHARHMPSHIFIQRGLWKEVSRSNQSAYEAAVDLWEPGDSVGDMVHALDWGQYGDLQHGDYAKAEKWIDRMAEIAEKVPEQERATGALPRVRARYVIETEQWSTEPVTESSGSPELLATGMSAARLGDLATAEKAEARLAELAAAAREEDSSYYSRNAKPTEIMHKEVAALVRLARGDTDQAIRLLEEGVEIAESMRPPVGAANPVKPVHELFGEVLLGVGKPARAAEVLETSLLRTPNRPRSLLGLARSYAQLGDRERASEQYAKLAEVWEGRDFKELAEAAAFLTPPVAADR